MIGPRQFLLGGVAAVALSGVAFAADVPTNRPAYKAAPAAEFSWQGQYIGIHGGYAWSSNDVTILGVVGELSPSSGVGGLQLGYNHHLSPRWVVGYEIDVSFGDLDTGAASAPRLDINAFGTARARLGYANGPWLLYATAGMAWATTEVSNGVAFTLERPHVGYAVGAGIEYALSRNWSAKIEYLFADLGETRSVVNGPQVDTDLTISTVRLGLNYRFANWGPVQQAPTYFTKAPVAVAGWTGPYIGVHAGYGWGSFDTSVPESLEPKGGFGGIQSGYNWQLSRNWVVGVEADSSWGSINQTVGATNVDIDATGTVRARLGYAMNNVLFYGTGGLAWAHADSVTAAAVRDQFYLGWTAGVGVEYAFSPRWSAKLEYLYADYGTINDVNAGAIFNASLDAHTVKIGLNYRASILELIGWR
jgi:outer membrane immunogenic protein